jgi:hypothetical protein
MLNPFFVRPLVLASIMAAAFVSTANAQDYTFSVNATFADPTSGDTGSITGTFTIDSTDNAVTAADLQSSAVGAFPAQTYNDLPMDTFSRYQSYEDLYDFNASGGATYSYNGPFLELAFDYPESGTVDLQPGGFGGSEIAYRFDDGSEDSDIVSGTVTETETPEPSTWALLFLGCAGLGFAKRIRKLSSSGLNSSASV